TGSARSGRRQATLTVSVRTARRSNGSSLPLNDNRARTSDVNPIIFSWHMAFGVQVSDPRWELAGQLVPERQGRIGFQPIYDWRFSLFSCRVVPARATSVRIGFTSTMRRGGFRLRTFTFVLRNRKVEPVSRTERDSLLSYRLTFAGRSWLVCRLRLAGSRVPQP